MKVTTNPEHPMKVVIMAISLILLIIILFFARSVVLTSLIGIGIGVLIMPVLDRLRRRYSIPRAMSALIVLLVLTLIMGTVFFSLYYLVADQVASLSQRAPELSELATRKISDLFTRFPWVRKHLLGFDAEGAVKNSLVSILHGFQLSFMAISGFAFAIIIGLYTAVGAKEYWHGLIEAFPRSKRQKAEKVLKDCAKVLRVWFKAQLLDMMIIGTMTAVGLWIVGVEYWAVFGLLTGVLGIIPYVGIMLVVLVASLITLGIDPSQVWLVLLVFGITQQVEGNIVLPMVMKGQVALPEVPLLIFMLMLGVFFGILGVFIAPALLAVMKVLYCELYLPLMEKK